MTNPEKMNLESMDIVQKKRKEFKKFFPEVFSDNKVNDEQLKRALGEWVEPSKERFGLNWPGKAECMKIIQQSSIATLKPVRDESLNFDSTENLFIEGDNLEVLKLLQKSYFNKVKMIYIDPPYNTGNEFIYRDRFAEALNTYLAYTGQIDDKGRNLSTEKDSVGRFHSNWLNMMYPRLYYANSLLREDGVIFISIDDNELHNLRELCDQIFGEESFVGMFPWRSRTAKADVPFGVSKDVEWVVCYCKKDFVAGRAGKRNYHESDDYEDKWRIQDLTKNTTKAQRPNSYFTIVNPKNGDEYPPNSNRTWSITNETFQDYYDKGKIVFPGDYDFLKIRRPAFRVFETEDKRKAIEKYGTDEVKMSVSTYLPEVVGRTEHGSKEIRALFDAQVFSYPKPTGLIKFFVDSISDPNAIVMDFFAGSGTTADAVTQLNSEDGGNRKFILVELPKPLNPSSSEQKTAADFCKANGIEPNIAALSRERVRRAFKRISEESSNQLDINGDGDFDLGFKAFKLTPSNFKIWEGDVTKVINIEQHIFDHIDHIDNASSSEDILYELLLNAGYPLTTSVEKITMANKDVFSIEFGEMLICLDKELDQAVFDAMVEINPRKVICLDEGFNGNDQLKANALQTFKSRSREKESEIVFKTV